MIPSGQADLFLEPIIPPDLRPLLRERGALASRAARHRYRAPQAVVGSVVSGLFVACDALSTGWTGLSSPASPLLGMVTAGFLFVALYHITGRRLAEGRLKDLAEYQTRNLWALRMPAATVLWMVARQRVWKDLSRAAYWLTGQALVAGLCYCGLKALPSLKGVEVIAMILTPFTLAAVAGRAVEFVIVSQWRWQERRTGSTCP